MRVFKGFMGDSSELYGCFSNYEGLYSGFYGRSSQLYIRVLQGFGMCSIINPKPCSRVPLILSGYSNPYIIQKANLQIPSQILDKQVGGVYMESFQCFAVLGLGR